MRISDWSSDVCSSDLQTHLREGWHGSGHGDAPKESCSASRSASTRPDSCRARMNGGPPSTGAWCLATGCRRQHRRRRLDRKSVVEGKRVSGRVDLGGRRHMKKKKQIVNEKYDTI